MITQNQLLMHAVYTAITEANEMKFQSVKERNDWEGQRTKEIFFELKEKYFPKKNA